MQNNCGCITLGRRGIWILENIPNQKADEEENKRTQVRRVPGLGWWHAAKIRCKEAKRRRCRMVHYCLSHPHTHIHSLLPLYSLRLLWLFWWRRWTFCSLCPLCARRCKSTSESWNSNSLFYSLCLYLSPSLSFLGLCKQMHVLAKKIPGQDAPKEQLSMPSHQHASQHPQEH